MFVDPFPSISDMATGHVDGAANHTAGTDTLHRYKLSVNKYINFFNENVVFVIKITKYY